MKQHHDSERGMRKYALSQYKAGSQAARQIDLTPVPKNSAPSALEMSIAYSKMDFSVLNRTVKEVTMKEEITNTTPGKVAGTLALQAREDFIGPMPAPKVLQWPYIPTPEEAPEIKDFDVPVYETQDAIVFTHGIRSLSDEQIWDLIDDYARDIPAYTGPYALTAYDRNAGKYTSTQYFLDVLAGDGYNPVVIISTSTIKFIEQQLKALLSRGIEVHYLNLNTKQYVHVPYTDLTGLDGHAKYYKVFGHVKNQDTLLWKLSLPEEPQLYTEPDPWHTSVPTDSDLPMWARSAKQLPVGWMSHYRGGLYWHRTDELIYQPDQDTACRILPVETIPGTRQDMEDLIQFFGTLTREFLHDNADLCWSLWEQLGRLEDYYGEDHSSFKEWMKPGMKLKDKPAKPEDPNANDSYEFSTRR